MRMRSGWRSQVVQGIPQGKVRRYEHGRVPHLLCECQELFSQCMGCLQLGAGEIIPPESTQHAEKLVRIVEVLTEVLSTDEGLFRLGSHVTFSGCQRCSY